LVFYTLGLSKYLIQVNNKILGFSITISFYFIFIKAYKIWISFKILEKTKIVFYFSSKTFKRDELFLFSINNK